HQPRAEAHVARQPADRHRPRREGDRRIDRLDADVPRPFAPFGRPACGPCPAAPDRMRTARKRAGKPMAWRLMMLLSNGRTPPALLGVLLLAGTAMAASPEVAFVTPR